MLNYAATTALVVMMCVCIALALWCEYKDGIFGHLGLILVGVSSFLVLLDMANGTVYQYQPLTVFLFVGIAIFMLRHLIRAVIFAREESAKPREPK